MPLNLFSVEAKLGRAEAHLQTYRRELMLWRDRKPYSIAKERSADFTRFYIVLRVAETPEPFGMDSVDRRLHPQFEVRFGAPGLCDCRA